MKRQGHNAGFEVIDRLAEAPAGFELGKKKHKALAGKGRFTREKKLLLFKTADLYESIGRESF